MKLTRKRKSRVKRRKVGRKTKNIKKRFRKRSMGRRRRKNQKGVRGKKTRTGGSSTANPLLADEEYKKRRTQGLLPRDPDKYKTDTGHNMPDGKEKDAWIERVENGWSDEETLRMLAWEEDESPGTMKEKRELEAWADEYTAKQLIEDQKFIEKNRE